MLLGKLGAILLGNMLAGTGVNRARYGSKDLQPKGGKGIIRASYPNWIFNTASSFK